MLNHRFFNCAVLLVTLLSFAVAGLAESAFADTYAGTCSYDGTSKTFSCYDPISIEPQTIPLWGPSWSDTSVTYVIEQSRGVTQQAISAVERAIAGWNAAIATVSGAPVAFLVSPGPGEKPQIVIRPKSGGGSVQGQALASTDAAGFFSGCKVNVSGKAFGSTNDTATVESIALQEIGHCLGLLHSDNSRDVMFGTVQNPANSWISSCDLDGWKAVMAWMLPGGTGQPVLPVVGSVSCGSSGPSSGVPNGVAVSTDKSSYSDHERVHITIDVDDAGSNPVSGAAVTVFVTTPKGTQLSGSTTTNAAGEASLFYDVRKGRDGAGTYNLTAEACKNGICAESGVTSFNVN